MQPDLCVTAYKRKSLLLLLQVFQSDQFLFSK